MFLKTVTLAEGVSAGLFLAVCNGFKGVRTIEVYCIFEIGETGIRV